MRGQASQPVDLRDELAKLAHGEPVANGVRPDITSSWQRALDAGLEPDEFDVPFCPNDDEADQLVYVSAPILGAITDDLTTSSLSVLLTNANGNVRRRWVQDHTLRTRLDEISLAPNFNYSESAIGTNAIGTAVVQGNAAFVVGSEHFADELTDMACAAAPIIDPTTGERIGIVDITSLAPDASALMLSVVRQAAVAIAEAWVRSRPARERLLLDLFANARRADPGAVAVIGSGLHFADGVASGLLDDPTIATIWDAAGAAHDTARVSGSYSVPDGPVVHWRAELIQEDGETVAAVVHLRPARDLTDPQDALTPAELAVANLVGMGLTNREVAERLHLSPHTVDAHLRHIYTKLAISSRVQLARLLGRVV